MLDTHHSLSVHVYNYSNYCSWRYGALSSDNQRRLCSTAALENWRHNKDLVGPESKLLEIIGPHSNRGSSNMSKGLTYGLTYLKHSITPFCTNYSFVLWIRLLQVKEKSSALVIFLPFFERSLLGKIHALFSLKTFYLSSLRQVQQELDVAVGRSLSLV